MDLRQSILGAVGGAILTGLPLYVFMENRVERRVSYEVTVKGLEKDTEATAKELKEMKLDLNGFKWTIEGKVSALEKAVAVSHAKDH